MPAPPSRLHGCLSATDTPAKPPGPPAKGPLAPRAPAIPACMPTWFAGLRVVRRTRRSGRPIPAVGSCVHLYPVRRVSPCRARHARSICWPGSWARQLGLPSRSLQSFITARWSHNSKRCTDKVLDHKTARTAAWAVLPKSAAGCSTDVQQPGTSIATQKVVQRVSAQGKTRKVMGEIHGMTHHSRGRAPTTRVHRRRGNGTEGSEQNAGKA